MCTGIQLKTETGTFCGRNFDYEKSYDERVCIVPRDCSLETRHMGDMTIEHGMIGIVANIEEYPLFYDAMNSQGLVMCGLNFEGNAKYWSYNDNKNNVAPFELIPYILNHCSNVEDAKRELSNINIINTQYNGELPNSPLHWLVMDENKSITVESTENGLEVHDNPVGTLTNNPSFDKQLFNLNNYRRLSVETPQNTFSNDLELEVYSRGMGGMGLPGDLSSMSRFVRATYVKMNIETSYDNESNIAQFFHILDSVEQQNGLTLVDDYEYEYTIYSDCYDLRNKELIIKDYNYNVYRFINFEGYDSFEDELVFFDFKEGYHGGF